MKKNPNDVLKNIIKGIESGDRIYEAIEAILEEYFLNIDHEAVDCIVYNIAQSVNDQIADCLISEKPENPVDFLGKLMQDIAETSQDHWKKITKNEIQRMKIKSTYEPIEYPWPNEMEPSQNLRDWFAGMALCGMGTWIPSSDGGAILDGDLNQREAQKAMAEWAYKMADAMLAARDKRQTTQS